LRAFRVLESDISRLLPHPIKLAKRLSNFATCKPAFSCQCILFLKCLLRQAIKELAEGQGLIGSVGDMAFSRNLCYISRHLIVPEILCP
jgi:hypothetical protein